MSFDLFFFKKKGAALTEQNIRDYLKNNLAAPNEQNNQWWFDNEDTGVYFCFETTDENDFENYAELFEQFNEFENTRFLFNLNFLRPDFFGKEAFLFVDKIIADLDLYILNPQTGASSDHPYKPQQNELYINWASTNNSSISVHSDKEGWFFPEKECTEIWKHNYNKQSLQAKYGKDYYVPRVYLVEEFNTKKIVTLTSWTEHIPNVFPKTDYVLIHREKKSIFKSGEEFGYISYSTFITLFGSLLDDFELPNYKIIHPENAAKAAKTFNSLKFEVKARKLGNIIPWDKVYNERPNTI